MKERITYKIYALIKSHWFLFGANDKIESAERIAKSGFSEFAHWQGVRVEKNTIATETVFEIYQPPTTPTKEGKGE